SKSCRERVGCKQRIGEPVAQGFGEFHVIRNVLRDRERDWQHSESRFGTGCCELKQETALPDAPITQDGERSHSASNSAVPERISEALKMGLPTDELVWSDRKIGLWKHEIAILTKRTIRNVSFCS